MRTKQKFYTVPADQVDKVARDVVAKGEKVTSISALGDGKVCIITEVVSDKPNLLLEELKEKE